MKARGEDQPMRALCVAAVAAVVLGGCGSGGTGGGTGGGSAGGGSGGGSAGGGAGGGAAATGNLGSVTLSQLESPFLGVLRSGSAAFYPSGPPVPQGALACTFTTVSGCEIADCVHDGGIPSFDGGRPTGAGTVSVQAGAVGFPLAQLTGGSYSGSANDGGVWWTGGETVTATGTGATDGGAPAFSASFTAPTRLVFSAPANDGGSLVVQKGVALPITWTAGTGSLLIALSSGQLVGGHSLKLSCTVNASAGTFTIPAALTQQLLTTNAGSLQLTNTTETTVTPSGWTIRAAASATGNTRTVTVP